jgi:hypothetical protein
MNLPASSAEYGDLFAMILLMVAVVSALAIVLRGFQNRHWKKNLVSVAGILLCSLLAWASVEFLMSAPQVKSSPTSAKPSSGK